MNCEVQGPKCRGRAEERPHHKKLKSRGGSDDPVNLLFVCWPCHQYIHGNPAWATFNGFMTPSWAPEG